MNVKSREQEKKSQFVHIRAYISAKNCPVIQHFILKCDMISMGQFILPKVPYFVKVINAIIALSLQRK